MKTAIIGNALIDASLELRMPPRLAMHFKELYRQLIEGGGKGDALLKLVADVLAALATERGQTPDKDALAKLEERREDAMASSPTGKERDVDGWVFLEVTGAQVALIQSVCEAMLGLKDADEGRWKATQQAMDGGLFQRIREEHPDAPSSDDAFSKEIEGLYQEYVDQRLQAGPDQVMWVP